MGGVFHGRSAEVSKGTDINSSKMESEGIGLVENNHSSVNFCLEWSEKELEALTEYLLSAAGVLASVVAIIFILVSKGYKKFVYRLTLYLMVAVQFHGVVSILRVVPVYYNGSVVATREGFEGLCAAAGFLINVVDWMILLIISWIVLYLVMVLVFQYSANAIRRKHEICGLVVVLILPFLFNWVPFLKNMYGLSGGQCGMKPSVTSNCKYDDVGLAFIFLLSYGPGILVAIIAFVSFGTMLIIMCRRTLQQEQGLRQPSVHQQGIKEVLPLLLFPSIYFLLWMGLVATGIYDATQGRKFQYSLMVINDIISGVIILLLPATVLLHSSINCYKKQQKRTRTLNTTTSYIVPNETSDQDEPLIIKGQGTNLKYLARITKVYLKGVSSGKERLPCRPTLFHFQLLGFFEQSFM